MREATLYRYEMGDQGTFGVLVFGDQYLQSIELPWKGNKSNISCIPAGEYKVARRYSPSFKRWTYWLQDVKDRKYILLHSANFAGDKSKGWQSQLQGCIALGCVVAYAKNKEGRVQKCVGRSREAIRKFEEFMENDDFRLIIKNVWEV